MTPRASGPHAVAGGSTALAPKTRVDSQQADRPSPDSDIVTVEAELVPEPVSLAEAKRIDLGLRTLADAFRESVEKLQDKVHHAKTSGVHEVLGFASWTAYLADVFGEKPLIVDRADRPELHRYLFAEGMSTRAIAAATRSSQSTVVRDLAGEPNDSPDEAASNLRDAMRDMLKPGPSKPVASTGLDGKEYKRPEPKASDKPVSPPPTVRATFKTVDRRLDAAVTAFSDLVLDDRLGDHLAVAEEFADRFDEHRDRLTGILAILVDRLVKYSAA